MSRKTMQVEEVSATRRGDVARLALEESTARVRYKVVGFDE